MKYTRIFRSQTGDTLVEVILALAVLGLVLGGSSVLASKSYKNLQSTQERSAGQRLAQSQLEYIKTYAVTNPDQLATVPSEFCMATVDTSKVPVSATDPRCAKVNTSGAPVSTQDPGYKLVTTVEEDEGGYNIRAQVQWEDIGGKTDSNELTYRIYKKFGAGTAAGTGGCTTAGFMPNPVAGATPPCVPVPPQIQVVARRIPNGPGNTTPSCATPAIQNLGGTSVRLRKVGSNPEPDRNQTTSSSTSSTLFNNLTRNGTYETSITGLYDPPGEGRYEVCGSPTLPAVVDTSTLTSSTTFPKTVNVSIRPICWPETTYVSQDQGSNHVHADAVYRTDYAWVMGARRGGNSTTFSYNNPRPWEDGRRWWGTNNSVPFVSLGSDGRYYFYQWASGGIYDNGTYGRFFVVWDAYLVGYTVFDYWAYSNHWHPNIVQVPVVTQRCP